MSGRNVKAAAADQLRVLHAYAGNLYGGLEKFLVTLARLRDLTPGMVPEFAICFDGRLGAELREARATIHLLGGARFSRPWTVLAARRRLARVLDVHRPDIVICHECWPHILCAPVARRRGIPVVFWMHGVPTGDQWFERLARRTLPDHVLANSRFIAGTVPRLFPAGVAHSVVYCPVEPVDLADRDNVRASVRRELTTSDEAVVILQHSRLSPYKGHSLLIEALGHLADHPGWGVWIAGGAQDASEQLLIDRLRSRALDLGVGDRVRFLGMRSDIPRLLAAADIHCQPNTGPEPFGIAFVEALQACLPVVSTRLGGAAEIVSPACGVLVDPDDAIALAEALRSLIDDPEKRSRLGASGPARAAELCDPTAAMACLHHELRRVAEDWSVGT